LWRGRGVLPIVHYIFFCFYSESFLLYAPPPPPPPPLEDILIDVLR
jgi:hypothetical protein